MRQTNFTEGEVFARFADIMLKGKHLEKKAELLYADYDSSVKPELDLGLGVFAGARDSLYGVTKETGDQLIGDAHPGGGTTTKLDHKAEGELAKVETIVERHKKIEDIARKTPSPKMAALMGQLVALANELDEDGFETLAKELDTEMRKFADAPAALPAGTLDTGHKGPPQGPDLSHLSPEERAADLSLQHPHPQAKPVAKPAPHPTAPAQFEMGKPTVTTAPAPHFEMGAPTVTNAPKG